MTRKKFVKQPMALGYQRNMAEGMAMYARWTGCTYEDYLRDEINRQNFAQALLNIKTTPVECMRPVCEAATAAIEQLRETFAGINLDTVTTMLDWAKENAPQIAEQHAADALDALPYNMQIMSRADHDTLHGYVCGIDLANGPDFTAGGGGHE